MKSKKEEFYYNNLCYCVEISYEAATMLRKIVTDFDKEQIEAKLAAMHALEQEGDSQKHEMMEALNRAFITPIEREDLIALSNYLDDITDAVEDVLLHIYISNVRQIRKDILPMIILLQQCIKELGKVLLELPDFKHSDHIRDHIIRVNEFEEEGDKLFVENMHRLHQEDNVYSIVTWRKIYECLENCMDTCEHAADIVSTVMMKNS
jgi:predicted phosphate transport protein (TIGR00153 family)